MKLLIKWLEINVENEEEALEIIQGIENLLVSYYQWNYELIE